MKAIAWSILAALAIGFLLGFLFGPALAAVGVSMLGLYIGLIMILHGCYFVATCLN